MPPAAGIGQDRELVALGRRLSRDPELAELVDNLVASWTLMPEECRARARAGIMQVLEDVGASG